MCINYFDIQHHRQTCNFQNKSKHNNIDSSAHSISILNVAGVWRMEQQQHMHFYSRAAGEFLVNLWSGLCVCVY